MLDFVFFFFFFLLGEVLLSRVFLAVAVVAVDVEGCMVRDTDDGGPLMLDTGSIRLSRSGGGGDSGDRGETGDCQGPRKTRGVGDVGCEERVLDMLNRLANRRPLPRLLHRCPPPSDPDRLLRCRTKQKIPRAIAATPATTDRATVTLVAVDMPPDGGGLELEEPSLPASSEMPMSNAEGLCLGVISIGVLSAVVLTATWVLKVVAGDDDDLSLSQLADCAITMPHAVSFPLFRGTLHVYDGAGGPGSIKE